MAQLIDSSFTEGHAQIDGRRYINERHIADDGQVFEFEYLHDDKGGSQPDVVMALRADRVNASLAVIAASLAIVEAGGVPISYAYFRKLFTTSEMQGIDKVDANLDAFNFTQKQIDEQRTTLKQIAASGQVFLAAPSTRMMLELYVEAGVLPTERVDEILGSAGGKAGENPAKPE